MIIPLKECDFSSIDVKERQDIEEWVEKEPSILGENLKIIQKEFAGFDDTKERLDLLAIDENGYLVIVELKRDDSGRDVNWQAIKYAAYCSTLTNDDIFEMYAQYLESSKTEAANSISEFLDVEVDALDLNQRQRMILVSKKYRKEVLATVMWLLDNNIDIKCVEIQPYKDKTGNLFIVPKVILPTPDTEEYRIKRNKVRMEHEKLISGIRDRKYWEAKGSKETVELTDKLLGFIQKIDSAVELKYNKNYIGLTKDEKPNNFISFKPKKDHLIILFRHPETEEYGKVITESGLQKLEYDSKRGLYKVLVTEKVVVDKEETIKKLMLLSYNFVQSK